MSRDLLATVEHILIDRALGSDMPLVGKSRIEQGLMALSVLMLALGLLLTLYGCYLWFASHYAPEQAALMGGAVAFGLSVLCVLGSLGVMFYKKKRIQKLKREMVGTLQSIFDLVEDDLNITIRENPRTSLLITSVAGFIVGEKIL